MRIAAPQVGHVALYLIYVVLPVVVVIFFAS